MKNPLHLGLPDGYVCGIVPASDTGAVEMAMWSLLGARGVEMCAWESFGSGWVTDVVKQLKLDNVTRHEADYGQLPDFSKVNFSNDVVFTYNGTTSGVKVPNLDWIPADREGLTICDASAVFAMDIDYSKLDVVPWSGKKSWVAKVHRHDRAQPPRHRAPRILHPRVAAAEDLPHDQGGKLIKGIFSGATINTISLLCIEDAVDGLRWAESIGGLPALISVRKPTSGHRRLGRQNRLDRFLAEDPATISNTSICLKITADWYQLLSADDQAAKAKQLVSLLERRCRL